MMKTKILFLCGICLALLLLEAGFASNVLLYWDASFRVTSFRKKKVSTQDQKAPFLQYKPLLILHVGPPKTGTTTIQDFATSNRRLLQEDNVHYLGNGLFEGGFCTNELVRICRTSDPQECRGQWNELHGLLHHHHSLNHTVLVSEENFSGFNERLEEDRLYRYLLPLVHKWRLHIIFTYRRHYELVSSKYMQLNNPIQRDYFQIWPNISGGRAVPSFSNFLTRWEEKRPYYEPVAVKTRWQEHFGNDTIHIFNFHSSKNDASPLLPRFYCQAIPQAPRACQFLLANQQQASLLQVDNPSSSKHLHYDMIAVAAYKNGFIHNTSLSRPDARRAVQEHALRLGLERLSDFRLLQLSERQSQALLSHSLRVEQALVPDFFLKTHLEAGFRQYTEAGRLASVDPKAVLEDPQWETFFSQL